MFLQHHQCRRCVQSHTECLLTNLRRVCSLVYFTYVFMLTQCKAVQLQRHSTLVCSRDHTWILSACHWHAVSKCFSLYIYVLSVWTWWVSEQNCSSGMNESVRRWIWQSDTNSRFFSFSHSVLSSLALAQFSVSPLCIFKDSYWSNLALFRWRETAGRLVAGLGGVAKNLTQGRAQWPCRCIYMEIFFPYSHKLYCSSHVDEDWVPFFSISTIYYDWYLLLLFCLLCFPPFLSFFSPFLFCPCL